MPRPLPRLRPVTRTSLALLACALPALLQVGRAGAARAQESMRTRAVREIIVRDLPGTRCEYFRLDRSEDALGAGEQPFGLVRWVAGPVDGEPHGWRGEREVILRAGRTRISHVERLGRDERSLAYREVRSRSGRRQHLSWTPDGRATALDTDGRSSHRHEYDLSRGGALPLATLELLRRGHVPAGGLRVYDPLSAGFDHVRVREVEEEGGRRYELLRRDGSSAGSFSFHGEELAAFRLQGGGSLATRIGEEEFRALRTTLEAREPGPRPSIFSRWMVDEPRGDATEFRPAGS